MTITTDDGRVFPVYDGELLSWNIDSYVTPNEAAADYPRARTVIAAMREHRPAQLERERFELLEASFDRMFGQNAARVLRLIDSENQ